MPKYWNVVHSYLKGRTLDWAARSVLHHLKISFVSSLILQLVHVLHSFSSIHLLNHRTTFSLAKRRKPPTVPRDNCHFMDSGPLEYFFLNFPAAVFGKPIFHLPFQLASLISEFQLILWRKEACVYTTLFLLPILLLPMS